MTGTLTDWVGFEHPKRQNPSPRRYAGSLELMAGLALGVSTVIAATAVSIGIARADTLLLAESVADRSFFAVAALLGLVLAGWGGITVLVTRSIPRHD